MHLSRRRSGWALDLAVVNGHIDDTVRNVNGVGYAQPPQLFLNSGKGTFADVRLKSAEDLARPSWSRTRLWRFSIATAIWIFLLQR